MATKLERAAQIYRSLGYEEASPNEVMELGIGTKEEQRIAKDGLKSGSWTEFKQLSKNTYGSVKLVDVDLEKLAIFAIKVGVNANRAAQVLRPNNELSFAAIASRGAQYASDFIRFACNAKRRGWEHSSSVYGMLCVNLVHRLNLPIPESVEYIKDWSVYAANALGVLKPERNHDAHFAPTLEEISSRFRAHIALGISLNAPATGPFSDVLLEGVKRDLLPKDKATELIFFALDLSTRPGDRKAWMDKLGQIGLDDDEIVRRGETLIPLLSLGDTSVIERFAPVLIAHTPEEHLLSILIAASSGNAKRIKQLVLKAASDRPKPQTDNGLSEWVAQWMQDEDQTISKRAQKLAAAWEIRLDEAPTANARSVQGLWQATPKLWQVPTFELGEISPEHLTELTAEICNRRADVSDVVLEQFLAMANAVAYRSPADAKLSLAGIRTNDVRAPHMLGVWAKNKELFVTIDPVRERFVQGKEVLRKDYTDLMRARDYVICSNIDRLPCMLSTPSNLDLSITVTDLADRLVQYQAAQCTFVFEPDLQLALARLDMSGATDADLQKLAQAKLFVQLPDGEKIRDEQGKPLLAGELVCAYLKDPFVELPLNTKNRYFWSVDIELPKSLRALPNRFGYNREDLFSIFPSWGDFALSCVRRESEVNHGLGIAIRQIARRRNPLPGGALMNLLAAQAYMNDTIAEDVIAATKEAWSRGLLLPNTAEVKHLDWRDDGISNLSSLAESMDHIAQDGILSVVWQAADDLIAESLNAPRMVTGTADIAKLLQTYLDEVVHAVQQGLAPQSALALPGIRRLAQKNGSSMAVTIAKDVVSKLNALPFELTGAHNEAEQPNPKKQTQTKKTAKAKPAASHANFDLLIPEIPFADIWKLPEPLPIIEDHVSLRAERLDSGRSVKPLLFRLTLPDSAHEYQVLIDGWMYGLNNEGQTRALESPPNAPFGSEHQTAVWLHWDTAENKLMPSPFRDWRNHTDAPLKGEPAPLSAAMLTMIVGLLTQDGDAVYSIPRAVERLVQSGALGIDMLRRATGALLPYEDVSPAKLVRVLEKMPTLLPVFWVMLTECVRFAGAKTAAESRPPTWVNRVLDVCLYHAYYLREAMHQGLIPPEDAQWAGLDAIANCKAKSAAVQKAKLLREILR